MSRAAPLQTDAEGVGALVGRPDLDDPTVRAAVVERLAADGRQSVDPDIVLDAARLGKRKALAFLRKLILPPPQARLEMPVRPILRSQIRAQETTASDRQPDSLLHKPDA